MPSQKATIDDTRPVKPPQRKRGRARVAALLDAGATVLAEQGFDGATMTAIAARAGASIGSLYQYFPTKEQLAAAIHSRQLDTLAAMLDEVAAEAPGLAPAAMVDRLFGRLVPFLEANPAFVVLGDRRTLDPAVKKQARARLRGKLVAILGAIEPPVPVARRGALAAVVLHLMRVAALLRGDDDRTIRDSAVAEAQTMLRRHLASRE